MNEPAVGRPKQFLADLAAAMRATAESVRESSVAQCQANADEYAQEVRERASTDVAGLRKIAADDVAVIRDQSKTQIEHVREEAERRVAGRQTLLEGELAELQSALEAELARVKQAQDEFEGRLAKSFDELVDEADPTIFASLASHMPDPPDFGDADPAALVRDLRATTARTASGARGGRPAAEPQPAVESEPGAEPKPREALPDHWWLDSPAKLAIEASDPGASR